MGLLLDRARKVFGHGPRELPPAEPFEISCACGLQLSGIRQDQRQFVQCPRCGQTLFVLPLSPYPAPRLIEAVPRQPRAAPTKPRRRKRPLGVRLRIRSRRAKRRVVRGLWRMVPPARWFSRGRMVSYAIVVLIVGTAALTFYLNKKNRLPGEIAAALKAGTAALKEDRLHEAREVLDGIKKQLLFYGSGDEQQREIVQLAAEVAVLDDLLRGFEGPPQQWDSSSHPSLVLDVVVSPAAAEDGVASGCRIDSRLLLGVEPARLDISNLKLFRPGRPAEPQRVIFGARIASVELAPDNREWVIRFVPDSGVWLTSELCLDKAGWPLDDASVDATRELLRTQKTWALEQR